MAINFFVRLAAQHLWATSRMSSDLFQKQLDRIAAFEAELGARIMEIMSKLAGTDLTEDERAKLTLEMTDKHSLIGTLVAMKKQVVIDNDNEDCPKHQCKKGECRKANHEDCC